jgi:hypothetical protein
LTVVVAILNLLGGVGGLIFAQPASGAVPAARRTLNALAIIFGASMLFSHLIPGAALAVILMLNGCVLLYLLRALQVLKGPSHSSQGPADHPEG